MAAVSIFRQTVVRKLANGKKRKTKSGNWRMKWIDPVTRERCTENTQTRDKGVAREIAREKERQLALGFFGQEDNWRKHVRMLFSELEAQFVDHVQTTKRKATSSDYALAIKHFREAVKPQLVQKVDTKLLMEYTRLRTRAGIGPETVNKELRAIRVMMNWARKCNYIRATPSFDGVFLRTEDKQPDVVDGFDSILAVLPTVVLRRASSRWWEVLLTITYWLGCRRGELIPTPHSTGLRWGNVSLEHGFIKIEAHTSKGRKDKVLPLSNSLASLLRQWRVEQTNVGPDDTVFPYHCSIRRLYDDLDAIEAAAGVKFRIKSLRSTAATSSSAAGVPSALACRITGHTIGVFEKHYVGGSVGVLRDALEKREQWEDQRKSEKRRA